MVSPVPPERREEKARQVQKNLSAYLTGGARGVPGLTGKETVKFILKRLKSLKISGREALVRTLGEKRVKAIELGAKTDFVKKWIGLAQARNIQVPPADLKRLPEAIVKEASIRVSKSQFLFRRKGFTRWKERSGRLTWRDTHGRYSKGPRRRR